MLHVSSYMQSLALCLNLLHLKHATRVRCSLNRDTIILPLLNVTLFNFSSFLASSLVATLITTDACYLLGLGRLSRLIVHTSTLFFVLKRFIANLLTFLLSTSIASSTLI
jgi:hypothetical protein